LALDCFNSGTLLEPLLQQHYIGLVRLAGWLNGWLIWRERKTLLVGWLADLA